MCDVLVRRAHVARTLTADDEFRQRGLPMRKRSLMLLALLALAVVVATVAASSGGPSVFTDWIARMHGVPGH
jgi:hypothetical protein